MTGRAFDLALACCRWNVSGANEDEVRTLSEQADWRLFSQLLRRHRIQGIAAKALQKCGVAPPSPAAAVISADARAIAEQNLRFARESARLADAFEGAGIPVLFVKGLTASALAYRDPYVKMSADIDIMVAASALPGSVRLLLELGYEIVFPNVDPNSNRLIAWHRRRKESGWRSGQDEVTVELHTALADNPNLIPGIGMTSPRRLVSAGLPAALPTLDDDDLFAYLCVHGASSAWFRLKWIADLAAFASRTGRDLGDLYVAAQQRRAGRAPAQALLLASRLSLITVAPRLRSKIEADGANRLLADIAFRQVTQESEPTERTLGTATIRLSQLLLLDGWRFRAGEAVRQLREVVQRT